MREKDIEKILVDEVRKLGGRAYKWVSPGNDGVPDRIVILPMMPPIFVELKTENGRLSALQKVQTDRLRQLGQLVEVVKGVRGLQKFFSDYGCQNTASAISARFNLWEDEGNEV